jgi:ABC-type sugar transport system ATPase subunit
LRRRRLNEEIGILGKEAEREVPTVGAPVQRVIAAEREKPTLVVRDLQTVHLSRVNLTARPGRVLGLYGLVGSGRSRFLRALIGMEPVVDGSIMLFDRPYEPKSPRHAARRGIVLVTEDRRHCR